MTRRTPIASQATGRPGSAGETARYAAAMLARSAVRPTLCLLGGLAVVPSGASAVGLTTTPKCVKPGAITTVLMDYSPVGPSQQSRQQARTIIEPNVYAATGSGGGLKPKAAVTFPFAPVTYAPSSALPGTLEPSFTQQVQLPTALSYDGLPVLSYYTRVEAYDASGTVSYGFDGRTADIEVDVPRVIPSATKVRRGGSMNVLAVGYGAGRKGYVHVVGPKNKRLRRVEVPSSPAPGCGRRLVQVSFKKAQPGSYKLVLNTSATSRSAAGGASAKVRVTR